jgi:hypothetical protein
MRIRLISMKPVRFPAGRRIIRLSGLDGKNGCTVFSRSGFGLSRHAGTMRVHEDVGMAAAPVS